MDGFLQYTYNCMFYNNIYNVVFFFNEHISLLLVVYMGPNGIKLDLDMAGRDGVVEGLNK